MLSVLMKALFAMIPQFFFPFLILLAEHISACERFTLWFRDSCIYLSIFI
jgi:hypothetical protein